MSKRIDDIWSEAPGLPKGLLFGGFFLYFVSFAMDVVYSASPGNWWYDLKIMLQGPAVLMIWAGIVLCAAALVGGGLAAGKEKE